MRKLFLSLMLPVAVHAATLEDVASAFCTYHPADAICGTITPPDPIDPDSDGDGVPDSIDQCPGTGQVVVDSDGCEAITPPDPVDHPDPNQPWPAWRQAMAPGTVAIVPQVQTFEQAMPDPTGYDTAVALDTWIGGCQMPNGDFHVPRVGGHASHLTNVWMKINVRQEILNWEVVSYPDGSPYANNAVERMGATHTYNQFACVPELGPMMVERGNRLLNPSKAYAMRYHEGSGWTEQLATNPYASGSGWGQGATYDPVRHRLYSRNSDATKMAVYDIASGTFIKSNASAYSSAAGVAMVYDPVKDIVIYAYGVEKAYSGDPIRKLVYWDASTLGQGYSIEKNSNQRPTLSGEPVGIAPNGDTTLHLVGRRIYYWNQPEGFENTINYITIPDDLSQPWEYGSQTFTGAQVSQRGVNGTFGRFFYDEKLKGFFLVNRSTEPFYFFAVE